MQTEQSTEPIDAGPTEAETQKEEGKAKGRTVKRLDIDWPLVKRRFQAGESMLQLSKELNVPANTIYSHIRRHRWNRVERAQAARVIAPAVQKTVAQETEQIVKQEVSMQAPAIAAEARRRLNDWFAKVLKVTDTLHRQIEDAAERRCEVEEIKSLSSSLETVDRIARRTFGLDSPSGSSVSVFSVAAPVVSCPVIDVEALPEASSAGVT